MIEKLKNYRPSGELVLGSIGGLLALIIALLFANFYIYRARGATPPVSITVSPSSGNFAVGASQEVSLFIQTASAQNYIEGFDVTLNATGQTQFVSLVNPTSPVEVVGIANPAAFTEVIKNVTPTSMRLSFVTLETDTSRLPTNLLIKFNINGAAEGAGGITINTGSSSVVGNNPSCAQGEPNCTTYSQGTITNGSYNFTTSTPSLWLVPSSANVNINDTFDVQVRLNTGNSQVSAVDSVLNYNTTYLAVTNVTPGSTFYRYVGIQDSADYVDEVAGKIKISGQIEAATNPTPVSGSDLLFATVTFQALQPIAATDVSFDFLVNDSTESNIVEYSTSNDILASVGNGSYGIIGITPTATPVPPTSTPVPTNVPTPTNTPTPTATPIPPTATPIPPTSTPTPTDTPTPTPTATPVPTVAPQAVALNLNLKLEGRDTKNLNNRDITLTIEETGAITNTTVNNAGSALSVSLGQLLPGNYTLRVKPKGYLSKTANITVAPGNSYTVDFGSNTFKAGDVSTIEDDLVNALDYSRLLTNFFLQGANIDLFDFNGDATVNGVDFSYMLRNWTASQVP